MRVTIKGDFQLTKGRCLNLVSVLQLLNPISLFALKAVDLALNSHALFVLLVDFANKLCTLLLAFHLLLHITGL